MPPTGDLAYNPGMCPDWELNRLPFGWQAYTQPTGLCQPGLSSQYFKDQQRVIDTDRKAVQTTGNGMRA